MSPKQTTALLRRRQLDKQLNPLQSFARAPRPRKGWIREVRDALGMTARQLAQRLGISQPLVAKFERSEGAETISLKSLRTVAEARDCTLVYAFVPNDSLETTLTQQAERRAAELLQRIEHTMRLEAQGRLTEEIDIERQELAQEMIRTLSRELWEKAE
jgi:predicted DNA-binding mobile mystery protein A